MRILITILFVSAFFIDITNAQTFHLKNFRVEHGMPSSQVYDIAQDSNGTLYIATDLGLTKYDGSSFKTYSKVHGLADNSISKLFVSASGEIWCLGQNRTFSLFKDDSAFVSKRSDTINKSIGEDFIRSFAASKRGDLILGISQPCFDKSYALIINIDGEISKIEKPRGFYFIEEYSIFGGYACPGNPSILEIETSTEKSNSVFDASRGTIQSVCSRNGRAYAVTDNQIVTKDKVQSYFLEATHSGSSLIDRDGSLWVSTYSGVLYFKNGDLTKTPIHFLENVSINKVFQDMDGSIWIGSSSKGLYLIKNPYVTVINKLNNIVEPDINTLTGNENKLAFSDSRNNLYTSDYYGQPKFIGSSSSNLHEVLILKNNVTFLEDQKRKKVNNTFPASGLSSFFGQISGIQWVGKVYGFSGYKNGNEVFNSSSLDFKERVHAIIEDSLENIWLGTPNGLFLFNGNNIQLIESTKGIRVDVLDFYLGNLVFGSRGNGIAYLRGNKLSMFSEKQGLISNFVNDLYAYGDELWCATSSGITKITPLDTVSINRKDGIPSAEVNVIWANQNQVVFGTKKGLVLLNKNYFENETRLLNVEIVEVKLGNTKLDYKSETLKLPYKKNGISLFLKATDFRIANPIKYRYRLSSEKNWSYTNQPRVTYASLPPGEWKFICSAQNERGKWGPINETLLLKVSTPYYLQWWFIALSLMISGALIWGIFQWRYVQSAKEERIQNELNVLKIKALSSQMNPHFIFNSLNSIQTFLIDNDLRMSNKYLTKFARLMRFTLNNSNETFVPLKDVLDSLELYMELEQLRFGDKFTFEINKSSNLELESTKVPSMLLQPFLENAILHGILPKTTKGKVSMKLDRIDQHSILATITDDGVGREFHKNKLGKKHKSHGLRITKERLQVFESLMGNKFNLEIHDLKNEEGKPKGTEIKLMLPCR